MRHTSQFSAVLLCFAIFISFSSPVAAQSGSKPAAEGERKGSQEKDKQFAEQFWNYLLSNNYKHWSPAPGKPANHFSSRTIVKSGAVSPHGTNVKMYVNRTAASNPDAPPVGSVLIMENYRQDKSLESISVMYRTPGFNPSANDWYWVNYNPDGSVASQQGAAGLIGSIDHNGVSQASAAAPIPKKLVGRSQSCIQCHKTGGGDLAFFNNKIEPSAAIAPLVQISNEEPSSTFKPELQKLQPEPRAALKQGALQNFNLLPQSKTVISKTR